MATVLSQWLKYIGMEFNDDFTDTVGVGVALLVEITMFILMLN